MAPPMPWECPPPPSVRIPGIGGAALILSATPSPAAMAAGLSPMGVDIRLVTPTYEAVYRRRPVQPGFCQRLQRFLWSAASEFTPQHLSPFEDDQAGLSIRVLASTDFVITFEVEVVAHENENGDEIDGVNFETSRAAVITASEQVEGLANREDEGILGGWPEPQLPLDLFFTPEGKRLTGIYRLGQGAHFTSEPIAVSHHIRFDEQAQGDVETSLLTSHLPFCSVAAHGVDERRWPWAIVTQILPLYADTEIAAPWDPVEVAREEINSAILHLENADILGESIANRPQLVMLFKSRGVDGSLLDDWTIPELSLAGIAELANAPLPQLAAGRLTGCAFPDIPHDCPKDVFDCAFSRWQELLFNVETQE